MTSEEWNSGIRYESYVGRWSRLVAKEFLFLLNVPPHTRWLDVGCGSGALTAAILKDASPALIRAYDASPDFVQYARSRIQAPNVQFVQGDAHAIPEEPASFDAAVSGLVLNFLADPARAVTGMARLVKPGGVIGAYVWDYAGEMQFMRYFWDAAISIDPSAIELDEGVRFPLCQPGPLELLWRKAGIKEVEVLPIDVETRFENFEDYWNPFLGGQGPAPGYTMSLPEEGRNRLRELLRGQLPFSEDGSIPLIARAWTVWGTV